MLEKGELDKPGSEKGELNKARLEGRRLERVVQRERWIRKKGQLEIVGL